MSQVDNRRLAKNTIMLYGRTAFSMLISLITSRVTLRVLGVDNYGINDAVGAAIGMFSVVSGSLSASIGRFITFELGRGDIDKLKSIFSTSLNIQLVMGLVIILLGETLGVWFLNTQMNIPAERMTAANWVLQFAIWSFFIGLTQVPYGACIMAHEKMNVYAWFSIIESVFRLIIVYLLYISPYDKLITLSFLGFMVSLGIRIAQRIYCTRTFAECHYQFILEKRLLKEMTGFAGWSFLTNTAWIFNTQGVNILINIFFGVTFNAARGVANSIQRVVTRFYGDFMLALTPQITKSYAAGELDEMNRLVCRGARFSYFLMFTLSLPFMFEAYQVLYLWLGLVPDYSVTFFRLSMIAELITLLGQTGVTSCMATGRIKWYTIIITAVGFLVFPLTWIAYKMGLPVESTYIIYIVVYALLDIIRLYIMRHLWGFPIMMYVRETFIPVVLVTSLAVVIPWAMYHEIPDSILKSFVVMSASVICAVLSVLFVGLKKNERQMLSEKAKVVISNKIHIKH